MTHSQERRNPQSTPSKGHTVAAIAKASSSRKPRIPPVCNRANSRTSRKTMPIAYSVKVSTVKLSAMMMTLFRSKP